MNVFWFADLSNLARTGNFSQAAELGNISQPAFSRRIKGIEEWAGVSLVDRSRHPIKLTSAGLQMLEAGQQALARLESERRQLREADMSRSAQVVTFSAQHSIGWRFFPAWLHEFEAAYGSITSRLRADNLPDCISDLHAGGVDFVIAYESAHATAMERHRGVESVKIGADILTPVCKPSEAGAPMFDIAQGNAPIPYLRFGDAAPIGSHLQPLLTDKALQGRLYAVYENSMSSALRIRAREGMGVAWLPRNVILPDLEAGLLMQLGNRSFDVELEIRLFRRRDQTTPVTRDIWDHLTVWSSERRTAAAGQPAKDGARVVR